MWWLAFPLLLAAFATVGDGGIWFLANLALPVSIVTAAALVIMWPQCCLIRQAKGWLKTRSRTSGGSAHSTGRGNPAGATPGGQARVGFAAPLACPAGAVVGVPQTSRSCRVQAPVDGGDVPAVLPSTGPHSPAGTDASPPTFVPAGLPPWLRLAANRRQVCG